MKGESYGRIETSTGCLVDQRKTTEANSGVCGKYGQQYQPGDYSVCDVWVSVVFHSLPLGRSKMVEDGWKTNLFSTFSTREERLR